jgi:hypothetical protein
VDESNQSLTFILTLKILIMVTDLYLQLPSHFEEYLRHYQYSEQQQQYTRRKEFLHRKKSFPYPQLAITANASPITVFILAIFFEYPHSTV